MAPETDRTAILELAHRHGIKVTGDIELNDTGLDFRAALVTDETGTAWVLRIPRRPDVLPRAENEARALRLLKGRLPVAVPDWRVFTSELIAYPRLPGTTAITIDPATKQPTWNIDKEAPLFTRSLGAALAALHGVSASEAAGAGLKVATPAQVRRDSAGEIERVRREIGVATGLWSRWQTWLDDDEAWPPFVTLIHGDLHAGHVLVDESSRVTGVLDWTEAEVGDPAVDFIFHLMGFGTDGLDRLLIDYEAAGGITWPGMRHHITERLSFIPVKYALFALASGSAEHLAAARVQLGIT